MSSKPKQVIELILNGNFKDTRITIEGLSPKAAARAATRTKTAGNSKSASRHVSPNCSESSSAPKVTVHRSVFGSGRNNRGINGLTAPRKNGRFCSSSIRAVSGDVRRNNGRFVSRRRKDPTWRPRSESRASSKSKRLKKFKSRMDRK